MENLIFVLAVLAIIVGIAVSNYSRRRKRRLIGAHQSFREDAPGAHGPSEPDHDHGEHPPSGRGAG